MGCSLGGLDSGELDGVAGVNVGFLPLELSLGDDGGLDNLDVFLESSVLSAHVHVHLGDSAIESDVSVLSVHVHRGGSAVVSDHHAVVLQYSSLLFSHLEEVKRANLPGKR